MIDIVVQGSLGQALPVCQLSQHQRFWLAASVITVPHIRLPTQPKCQQGYCTQNILSQLSCQHRTHRSCWPAGAAAVEPGRGLRRWPVAPSRAEHHGHTQHSAYASQHLQLLLARRGCSAGSWRGPVWAASSTSQRACVGDQGLCLILGVCDEVVVKGYGSVAKDGGHDAATVPEHCHLITLQGKGKEGGTAAQCDWNGALCSIHATQNMHVDSNSKHVELSSVAASTWRSGWATKQFRWLCCGINCHATSGTCSCCYSPGGRYQTCA
jgi:hypothetical protein